MVTPRHTCTLGINIEIQMVPSCKMTMHMVHPRHTCSLDINIDHACTLSKPNGTPCQCTIYHANHRQKVNVLYIMRTIDQKVNALYIMLTINKNSTYYLVFPLCILQSCVPLSRVTVLAGRYLVFRL